MFLPKYIAVKFDICSTHKSCCDKTLQVVNTSSHDDKSFISYCHAFSRKKYLCVLTTTHFLISFNTASIIYEACVWQIVLLHAFYFYRFIFYIKGLLGTKPYKTSHHCFVLQTPTLFSLEYLQKMCNINLKIQTVFKSCAGTDIKYQFTCQTDSGSCIVNVWHNPILNQMASAQFDRYRHQSKHY